MSAIVPLGLLRTGDRGEVVDVIGQPRLVARLAEKGVRPGCWLEAIKAGDPILIRVEDTRLSLRGDGQVDVMVRLADS